MNQIALFAFLAMVGPAFFKNLQPSEKVEAFAYVLKKNIT